MPQCISRHKASVRRKATVKEKDEKELGIRRRRFEAGGRRGASSKEEESSKEPVSCSKLTRG